MKNVEIERKFLVDKKGLTHLKSADAVSAILYQNLQNIKMYKEKILKAYDDEDLHQLRINIRKSRAILGMMGAVFSDKYLSYHDKQLSSIAKLTNKKRDLDVFIAAFDEHFSDEIHDELRYFYHDISRQREGQEEHVKKFLQEKALTSYLKELESFLTDKQSHGKMAKEPIAFFLQERVESILQHIMKKVKRYERERKEEHLHKVRISFKKLRYILESFERLFYKKNVKALLKRVKKLQNDLGLFNDLCVQHLFLENYLKEHQLDRSNESTFESLLSKIERDKVRIQEKIEKDLNTTMDIDALREGVKVKFV